VTVFVVRLARSAPVAQALLGEQCWGWLVTDRWRAYPGYPSWRRQWCWAHRRRAIEAMVARGGRAQESGEALPVQARPMCHGWHRGCDGTRAHASFRTSRPPSRWEVERLLEAGQTWGAPKPDGPCREILKRRQARWTFVRHAGVDPPTNAAERASRPGVLWRKGSFGTQRADGSRFVEAMRTVAAPLKQQHRHVLDYLTVACEAALSGEPPPALLPTPKDLTKSMCPAA
jgi:transposase